jgi:hypothetical protein
MIQARFLDELLEEVCGRSCLVLVVAHSLHGVFRTGAAYLLIDATIIISCGLLVALFMPLLASLNALLGALDGDVGRHLLAAARGRLKLDRLSAGSVRGGNITVIP